MIFGHKKRELSTFETTQMNLEDIMLSEIRQRQILHDLGCLWNLVIGELIEAKSRRVGA